MNLLSRLALTGIASLVLVAGSSEARYNVNEAFNKDYLKKVFSNPMKIPRDYRKQLGDNWQEQILGEGFDSPYQIEIQEATNENDFGGSENGLPYQVPRTRIRGQLKVITIISPEEMETLMKHIQDVQRLNKETFRKIVEDNEKNLYKNFGSIPLERRDLYGRVLRSSTGEAKIDVWKDFWDNAFRNLNKPEIIDLRGR